MASTFAPMLAYTYVPFLKPLPIWNYWYLLLLPLVAAVSIVYKSIKCRTMNQVPREAAMIFIAIVAGLVGIAAALVLIVRATEY